MNEGKKNIQTSLIVKVAVAEVAVELKSRLNISRTDRQTIFQSIEILLGEIPMFNMQAPPPISAKHC